MGGDDASRKKSESRRRTAFVGYRALPAEKSQAEANAAAAEMTLADLIRWQCQHVQSLADAAGLSLAEYVRGQWQGGTVATSPARRDMVKVEVALNRIGGNVNQIAHVANIRGTVTDEQIDRAVMLLEEALQIVAAEFRR